MTDFIILVLVATMLSACAHHAQQRVQHPIHRFLGQGNPQGGDR
jgi:hypothetical protein